jgi:NAD(P)H-hydrate epimerase
MTLTLGLTEPADVARAIGERAIDANKRSSGVVLVVAGSRAMPGAARLAAGAAMRVGAGYVVVAAPAGALDRATEGLPEAVRFPLAETGDGTIASGALEAVLERAATGVDALAVGPGLTTHPETVAFVHGLVRQAPVPLVIDADALGAFAGRATELVRRGAGAVLTPHGGEAARLGMDTGAGPLAGARWLAAETGAVALLKGARTVVADPDGSARINPTGAPALATAGTGDVLTGAIAGLLGTGLAPFDAAWAGAYLHGLAGMFAGRIHGGGVLAREVADLLPEAVAHVRSRT